MQYGDTLDDTYLGIVKQDAGWRIYRWDEGQLGPQPTDQQFNDAANDLTQVDNGDGPEVFSVWYAKHGGDAIATAKHAAKVLYNGQQELERVLRAIVVLTVDELNFLRTWTRDFKAVVAAAANLNDIKTGVAGLPTLDDRTNAQVRTAIFNNIDGE